MVDIDSSTILQILQQSTLTSLAKDPFQKHIGRLSNVSDTTYSNGLFILISIENYHLIYIKDT